MMNRVSAIEQAEAMGMLNRAPATYGYYRQPNGWITVSPTTDLEQLQYMREGWQPLPQYGHVEMNSAYAADNPLEGLFIAGGAKELSVEQIIESGLHLNPPRIPSCRTPLSQYHKRHVPRCWVGAKTVEFPQIDKEYPGYPCRFCDRPLAPTEKARDQHEMVAHKDERGDIRQGESLASYLASALRGGGALPAQETHVESGAVAVVERKPYACGICDESYTSPINLTRHVKKAHKEPKADGE